ncbi:MAG: ABC transporter permease [Longimicrobiales bacterium]
MCTWNCEQRSWCDPACHRLKPGARRGSYPKLPLENGGRIVRIENWDATTSAPERRSVNDFLAWREQLTSIGELGAYRTLERNLIVGNGRAEPVRVAAISAAAFPLTRVPPLSRAAAPGGRRAGSGAADVVVIGHEIWQRRFLGDAGIIGSTVQLGRATATVVGVMPHESFARNIGGNALGVRVRYAAPAHDEEPRAWHKIVGVARNLGMEPTDRGEAARVPGAGASRAGHPADSCAEARLRSPGHRARPSEAQSSRHR